MAYPNREESKEQTTAVVDKQIADQRKRIFTFIAEFKKKGVYDAIFYEDMFTENRTYLQSEGYTTYLALGKDADHYYHILWK